ncbi:hypothetical protein AB0J83_49925, partial [Actinoplanes sp. NPDC049596]
GPTATAGSATAATRAIAGSPVAAGRRATNDNIVGIALGEEAAAAMIEFRRGDGSDRVATWPIGTAPGQWRPTPPGFAQEP